MTSSTTSPTDLSDADKAAVASLTQRVIAAWAYHDADAFAGVFVDDGTMTMPGVHLKGRASIRDYMADGFAGRYKGTQVTGKPIDLRPLGPDAAILLSQGGVMAAGESEVSDAEAIRAAWVVVRHDGQWRLSAYVNTPRDKAA
ncbi:SgcJ/EcaC family oxidoreductase [Dactylosporangium sp. NPDC049140]|uniref:SgcJ/EcaC family oxidoreductase n=1 Tax=unclassified Dactylosporangium TaxID=2621675 RepID=UPI0033C73276